MNKPNQCASILEADAVVATVDSVNRELAAVVAGVVQFIYVPPDCAVVLRGERVKLRMVQPRDRVRIAYADRADALVARAIEIRPAYPSPALSP